MLDMKKCAYEQVKDIPQEKPLFVRYRVDGVDDTMRLDLWLQSEAPASSFLLIENADTYNAFRVQTELWQCAFSDRFQRKRDKARRAAGSADSSWT